VSPGVRRVVFMVLVFVLGLVVGFTVGFPLGLLKRSVDSGWFEAVGTWVSAGITFIAVILAGIVFFSEEYTRRREHRRQTQTEHDALQREADLVTCDVYHERASSSPTDSGKVILQTLRVEVTNPRSNNLITELTCRVSLDSIDWPIPLRDRLGPGERHSQAYEPSHPFEVRKDNAELHQNVEFTFVLGGAQWAKRVRQPARRLVAVNSG
jgi:hypothetical protein